HQRVITSFFYRCRVDRIDDELTAFREQALFFGKRDPAEDDFRWYFHHSRLFVDGDDGKHDSIFRDVPAIADDDFADFLQAPFIDQNPSDRSFAGDFRSGIAEAENIAGLDDHHFFLNGAGFLREFGMAVQLTVHAVNRDEVFRLHQR